MMQIDPSDAWSVVRNHQDVRFSARYLPDDAGVMKKSIAVGMAENLNRYVFGLKNIAHTVYVAIPIPYAGNEARNAFFKRYI